MSAARWGVGGGEGAELFSGLSGKLPLWRHLKKASKEIKKSKRMLEGEHAKRAEEQVKSL